ncbi:MAG: sigma-70 family RNA polymerase sigma factor [Planctomycetota bacterium]|nr:MAG: sigma-70 family RNA polymerase sigma factor [Planctomycetota bacterium]
MRVSLDDPPRVLISTHCERSARPRVLSRRVRFYSRRGFRNRSLARRAAGFPAARRTIPQKGAMAIVSAAPNADASTVIDDHELMRRIAQGDRAAQEMIVRRHQARVLALAMRFLHRRDLAEDVCQEAFLRIFRAAANYRPTSQFSTWLYRVVANLCWDLRRRAARAPLAASEALHEHPATAGDVGERAERVARVRAAVAALPDRQRLALILHRYENLDHARIAEITGWSRGAVESCIVRAYRKLRSQLADLAPPTCRRRQSPAALGPSTPQDDARSTVQPSDRCDDETPA